MNSKQFRVLKCIFILGSILAALKLIFVDYTMDEEYQVVMAYRHLMGDKLFGTMWEPHQTSAFFCVWLMQLFRAVTNGMTGVVLFLRCCTTLVQGVLAWWFYRVCSRYTKKEYAFILGICYFNIVPKIIQIPEFSNLQLWFYTVIVLSMINYYSEKPESGRSFLWHKLWLVLAGAGMAFEVLSYPSSLLLFPFFLICIFLQSKSRSLENEKKNSLKLALTDCFLFAGVCGISALIWLCHVLYNVSLEEFLRNIKYVLDFDLTHDMSLFSEDRFFSLVEGVRTLIWPVAVIFLVSFIIWLLLRKKQAKSGEESSSFGLMIFIVLLVLSAEAVQVFYWVVLQKGYEMPMIHFFFLLLAAALVWRKTDERKKVLFSGLAGSILTVLIVIYTSDLTAWYAIGHGMLGVLLATLLLLWALEKELGEQSRKWVWILMVSFAAVSIFGKAYTLRGGKTDTNSVLGIRGVVREGPVCGIFMNYMQAYILNSTYEEFEEYVEEGANCLIVTNMVGTAGTTPYMFRDCNICHFSIVDPTSYDERLLVYWDLYPEKCPDVIIVDCWYGQLQESMDSWIMQYIENDFGYKRMIEGKYLRYYLK